LKRSAAFTLVELLVSISILAILISLTVMGISKFRKAAWATDTQNELMTIQNAIQAYHSTFNALPGPLPNRTVGATTANVSQGVTFPDVQAPSGSASQQFDVSGFNDLAKVTGSENLVLGLMGGLVNVGAAAAGNPIVYDPSYVGQGPMSLNSLSPKKYGAFLDNQNLLDWRTTDKGKTGKYQDDIGTANDTLVPELVDRFPQGMPILYLRADKGAAWNTSLAASPTSQINNIITDDSNGTPSNNVAQYHLSHIKGYTGANPPIGESKTAVNGSTTHGLTTVTVDTNPLTGPGPYTNAYPYFVNSAVSTRDQSGKPGSGQVARKKDDYILISPGMDRIYGTKDDITNFGSVSE
jgi:prepilin-type N-terminal cleavage/methylation domain-containing protein